jgi:hypothetical protein
MLWAFGLAAVAGIVFGFFLRWPAVLAVSAMIAGSCVALMPITQWSLLRAAALTFGLLAVFQWGYLAGLLLSRAWVRRLSRTQASPTCAKSNSIDHLHIW